MILPLFVKVSNDTYSAIYILYYHQSF